MNGAPFAWDITGTLVGAVYRESGLVEPLEPTRMPDPGEHLADRGHEGRRIIGADNQSPVRTVTVSGAWRSVHLSPGRGYLLAAANLAAGTTDMVGVTRISDGAGNTSPAGGAAHVSPATTRIFLYVPINRGIPRPRAGISGRGAETSPALTQPAFATQPGVRVQLALVRDEGSGR